MYFIIDCFSFEEVKCIVCFIKDSIVDFVVIVIVVNKCDFEYFWWVKYEEGKSLLMELNCVFYEVIILEDNK